jgi:alcohol dehydrogenase, propanol-preferring
MQAAILENGKVEIKEVPKPTPHFEEALVKMTAAGVCHSDLHLLKGDWPQFVLPFPIPLGHEGIGIVEEVGPGAEKLVQPGDRVILGLGGMGGGYWCGACEYCLSGRPRLCKETKVIIGTYAEYISLWAKSLVKLPAEVGDREVSLACGGLTAYSAVKKLFKYDVLPGKPVAIIGAAGGLGHYAVQIAKAFGYGVIGVDVGPDKLEFVRKLGADFAIEAAEAAEFVKGQFDGVYASIVFSPKLTGFKLGLDLLKRGGLFVSVGIPAASEGALPMSPLDMFSREPVLIASVVGNVEEMRELIQLAAQGKVKTTVSRLAALSELNQIFEELEKGTYPGRAVINDMTK